MSTEYLTTAELAGRLKYDERTIREKLMDSVLLEGVHYLRPFGRRKILFIWQAIEEDLSKGTKFSGAHGQRRCSPWLVFAPGSRPENCLDFYFDGARYREQTALPDTPENRTKLSKLADKLEREIARGKFNYAEFFGKPAKEEPRVKASDAYPRAGSHQPGTGVQSARQANVAAEQTPTFVEFLEIWRNENFVQFRKSYQRTVDDIFKAHLVPKFGNTRVGDIRREDLLTFRSDLAKAPGRKGLTMSPKRVNAIMALMSQIMSEASDRYHFTNPYQNIKSLRLRKPDVEPFTLQEVNLILNTVREDMRNYYIVRFFTGMRTGEIDGLKWKYVDLERRQILIRSTIVAGIEEETARPTTPFGTSKSQKSCAKP